MDGGGGGRRWRFAQGVGWAWVDGLRFVDGGDDADIDALLGERAVPRGENSGDIAVVQGLVDWLLMVLCWIGLLYREERLSA